LVDNVVLVEDVMLSSCVHTCKFVLVDIYCSSLRDPNDYYHEARKVKHSGSQLVRGLSLDHDQHYLISEYKQLCSRL